MGVCYWKNYESMQDNNTDNNVLFWSGKAASILGNVQTEKTFNEKASIFYLF